jgi:transposase-like protein
MAQQPKLSRIDFQKRFSTEEACEKQLFRMKWPHGYHCERCGWLTFSTISTRKLPLYQCNKCKYQATVTVNTVMEKTRTDLTKWFLAIYNAATDKRGYSAVQLSKDIEVSYPTAWLMLHKIREAMGQRDAEYQLAGIIELDDSYFGGPKEGGKRGRGTEKTKVLVGLSANDKGHPEYVKMEVVSDIKGTTLMDFAGRQILGGSTIETDEYRSYRKLSANYDHRPQVHDSVENPEHLKWLHVIVSNAKAMIAGTYHGLDGIHMQRYLNEFCYRFNRRRFEGQGFFRLLDACVSCKTITYAELT